MSRLSNSFEDSDDDQSNDPYQISYRQEKQYAELQGRMKALDVVDRFDKTGFPEPCAPISEQAPNAKYRDDKDLPPLPPIVGVRGARRRGTLDLHETEDADQIARLREMYGKVAACIDLRERFMSVSLQNEQENPKNLEGWKIYPEPPAPMYHPGTKQFAPRPRKEPTPANIGSDFHFSECEIPEANLYTVKRNEEYVYEVFDNNEKPIAKVPTLAEYYEAYEYISSCSTDGPCKTFAFRRLQYLDAKWNLYYLLNQDEEVLKSKQIPHRDFYNVRKVDTHVHHSACMTQKHLLRFIKSKLKKSPNELVIRRDGKELTLEQVFESLNLTAYDLNIDTLDMHAHQEAFHRFDKFNLKYNPIGESRLREIFLKTDNFVDGRYLAELTKEVFSDLEQSKYQMAEYRISIYGRSKDEWTKLAKWVVDNKLFSSNVRWLIQVPRLYNVYKQSGIVDNFGDVVRNVFEPLFEVTKDPTSDPKLHIFLQRVIGFDSVDDESKADQPLYARLVTPDQWNTGANPPYTYWLYYLYANMASLNQYRKKLGFNTFVLRPHAGEAGDPEHLIGAFLTSQGIAHGILLRKLPFIQFLYYLEQVGIAMSPLSNNALFLSYEKNPFVDYFRRGLNVSLSTDDPLQFSFTREPLIEEYSIAIQIYKLSAVDSRELALYSVKQSGFEHEVKDHWGYNMHNSEINIEKTNIPEPRLAYRRETLQHERALVDKYGRNNRVLDNLD